MTDIEALRAQAKRGEELAEAVIAVQRFGGFSRTGFMYEKAQDILARYGDRGAENATGAQENGVARTEKQAIDEVREVLKRSIIKVGSWPDLAMWLAEQNKAILKLCDVVQDMQEGK